MTKTAQEIEKAICSYLGVTRLVGVKILQENVDGNHPAAPMTFCQAVRRALEGEELIIGINELDCPCAELCLGFRQPMFVDVEPRIKSKTKAVRVGLVDDADVVLFVLNPEQTMIMSILLGGIKAEFKGEMGVCGEVVAKVYNEGQPNVSFLCNGARELGGFEPHEVILGLPYTQFLELPGRMNKFASLSRSVRGSMSQFLRRF